MSDSSANLQCLTDEWLAAKKLKQTWVETKKIKKQWKAEKRKLGLMQPAVEREEEQEWKGIRDGRCGEDVDDEERTGEESSDEARSSLSRKKIKAQHDKEDDSEQNVRSLRERAREAYSRSSLHTFKSGPLQKKRSAGHAGDVQRGRGRGRGQPNMKLRMGVLLEKIKRNMAE